VLIHYDGFGTRESLPKGSFPYDAWNSFINLGIYGPTVFFIASGFALTASISKGKLNLTHFVIRRIFRLLPLYIFVLALYFTFQSVFKDFRMLSIDNALYKVLLIDVFMPKYFYDDPVGVLATLPIEFWWSLFVPFFHLMSRRFGTLADIILGLSTIFLNLYLQDAFKDNSYLQSYQINAFWKYGLCFYMGYIAFKIRFYLPKVINNRLFFVIGFPSMLAIEIFTFDLILNIYIITILFLVLFDFNAVQKRFPLIGNFLLALGTVCFSVYLLHSPIRQCISSMTDDVFIVNAISIILLSASTPLTYLFVEKKGIRIGEVLYVRMFLKPNP
jgi:peptidoglycan/LPS O-acetylase OafA/YrhL